MRQREFSILPGLRGDFGETHLWHIWFPFLPSPNPTAAPGLSPAPATPINHIQPSSPASNHPVTSPGLCSIQPHFHSSFSLSLCFSCLFFFKFNLSTPLCFTGLGKTRAQMSYLRLRSLGESLQMDRMGRGWGEPMGLPGKGEEDSFPLICSDFAPHLGRSMYMLQAYHTSETPVFASSNPMPREMGWETHPRGEVSQRGLQLITRMKLFALITKQKYLSASEIWYHCANNVSQSWAMPGNTDVFLLQHHWK